MEIDPKDIIIQTYRKSDNGHWLNQHDNCIRITHIPSGFVTESSEERSVHKNKAIALEKLKALLKQEKFLEDAYDNPESANGIFGVAEPANNMYEMPFTYPETTYQPLPSTNSRPLECRLAEAINILHGVDVDSKIVAQIIRLAKEMEE